MTKWSQCLKRHRERSGMALVLVMCLLVLLSCLFVGYFSSIMAERISAKNYAATNEARQLADSALNMVLAQLMDATTQQPDAAWTSQPGMIRTFDSDGNAIAAYKLYSSDRMVIKGAFNARAAFKQELPEDWSNRKAEFVDLNAPSKRTSTWRYPIVDPAAVKQVEGFTPDAKWNVSMPVRWIYVLRDGRFDAGTSLGNGQVKITAASVDNPIVGRIAFWTDDETCKVDINTASQGVFWDTPRTQSLADQTFAMNQPATKEYQRFPGHPATVCLSTVLPSLVSSGTSRYSKIYALAPRVATGGSQEGSVDIGQQNAVANDTDRLYASLDELLYTMERQSNSGLVSSEIERGRFFLTVASRSPELNLFNRPRVTLWPIDYNTAKRSQVDALMALASTVSGANNARFYFTRQDARSKTLDFTGDSNNARLYQYLQQLTSQSMPGFGGGSLASKYGGATGRDQILTEIFDFVRCANLSDPSTTAYTSNPPGQVLPIEVGATRGIGRFPTLSEVAMQFYAQSVDAKTGKVNKMGAVLLLSMFNSAQGYPAYQPSYKVRVTTAKSFVVDANPPFNFSGDVMVTGTSASPLGGAESFTRLLSASYPYQVKNIPVSNGVFTFGGGTVDVSLVSNTSPEQVLQTIHVELPSISAPLPTPVMPMGSYSSWTSYSSRLTSQAQESENFFQFDVVRSVSIASGDARLIAAQSAVPLNDPLGNRYFAPGDVNDYQDAGKMVACSLRNGAGRLYIGARSGSLAEGASYGGDSQPSVPPSVTNAADWDNGVGNAPDGAYIGKADEGCTRSVSGALAYYNPTTATLSAAFYFNQRQIASPVVLGSLPTGVVTGRPWETLLFNPHPAGGRSMSQPYDFLWLDLFCVPTVEPYALSTPLSASGRVNLNCELVPFTGLVRTTALRAALKSVRIGAIPTGDGAVYKKGTPVPSSYYYDVSAEETLKGIDQRFAGGGVFRSAAEICGLDLVPVSASAGSMEAWWQAHGLTGDNMREMPYNHLYPLLTTQSNVYTVHCRAQSLVKSGGSDPQVWQEGRDAVNGEYRVSSLVERWIDPADTRLGSVDVFNQSLTPYYRFRVGNTLPFVP